MVGYGEDGSLELGWVSWMQNRLIGWRSEASRDGYAMAVSLGGCCRDAIFPLWLC